jgi:hypothetical protein
MIPQCLPAVMFCRSDLDGDVTWILLRAALPSPHSHPPKGGGLPPSVFLLPGCPGLRM